MDHMEKLIANNEEQSIIPLLKKKINKSIDDINHFRGILSGISE